jgi:hypothetical protein
MFLTDECRSDALAANPKATGRSGKLKFVNRRAEDYWCFRELLELFALRFNELSGTKHQETPTLFTKRHSPPAPPDCPIQMPLASNRT